jgi:ligand-binding sensor domain-containing protein
LLHDRRDTMWVATQGRAVARAYRPATAAQTTDIATMRDGLASDAVQALLEDREGNLWLGTPGGLQRLSPHRVHAAPRSGRGPRARSHARRHVVARHGVGPARFSGSERRTFTRADGSRIGGAGAAQGIDGELWVATERGVATYANGRFSPLRLPPDANLPRIFAIATTAEDVWLRDFYFRLHRWRDGRLLPLGDIPDHFRKNLLSLHADRTGGYGWAQLGPARRPRTRRILQRAAAADRRDRPLHYDKDGTLWAGGEEGMSRITGGEVLEPHRAHGFPAA